jgi:hypothetical protein
VPSVAPRFCRIYKDVQSKELRENFSSIKEIKLKRKTKRSRKKKNASSMCRSKKILLWKDVLNKERFKKVVLNKVCNTEHLQNSIAN